MMKQRSEGKMLEVGTMAPDFTLLNQNGEEISLSQYRGQKVILYFYPKDNTPGCTKQACGFAQLYPDFVKKGAVILGVSKDSVKSHKKFEEKYQLPFTLLSDPDLVAIQAYDVWKEKNMYGKKVMGVVRTTYLINEEGIIEKAYTKVKAAQNPNDMLEVLTHLYRCAFFCYRLETRLEFLYNKAYKGRKTNDSINCDGYGWHFFRFTKKV